MTAREREREERERESRADEYNWRPLYTNTSNMLRLHPTSEACGKRSSQAESLYSLKQESAALLQGRGCLRFLWQLERLDHAMDLRNVHTRPHVASAQKELPACFVSFSGTQWRSCSMENLALADSTRLGGQIRRKTTGWQR